MSFDTLLSLLFLLVFIVLPLLSRVMRQGSQPGRGTPPRRPGQPRGPSAEQAGEGGAQTPSATPPWLAEAQRRVREARGEAEPQASTAPRERPLVSEDPFGPPTRPGDRTLVPDEPFGPPPRPGDRTLVPEEPFGPAAHPGDRTLVPEDPFGRRNRSRPGGLVPEDPFERGLVGEAGGAGAGAPGSSLGREGAPGGAPAGALAGERAPGRIERGGPHRDGGRRGALEREPDERAAPAYGRRRRARARARLGPVDLLQFDRRAIVNGLIWHEILDEPAWKRRQRRASSRPRSR